MNGVGANNILKGVNCDRSLYKMFEHRSLQSRVWAGKNLLWRSIVSVCVLVCVHLQMLQTIQFDWNLLRSLFFFFFFLALKSCLRQSHWKIHNAHIPSICLNYLQEVNMYVTVICLALLQRWHDWTIRCSPFAPLVSWLLPIQMFDKKCEVLKQFLS